MGARRPDAHPRAVRSSSARRASAAEPDRHDCARRTRSSAPCPAGPAPEHTAARGPRHPAPRQPRPDRLLPPGAFTTMTVLSAGLLSLLDENELDAVIEHEKAHATQRHDIVLMLFRAWRASCPGSPSPTAPTAKSGSSSRCSPTTAPAGASTTVPSPEPSSLSAPVDSLPSHRFQGTWTGTAPTEDARHRILRLEATPLPTGQKQQSSAQPLRSSPCPPSCCSPRPHQPVRLTTGANHAGCHGNI